MLVFPAAYACKPDGTRIATPNTMKTIETLDLRCPAPAVRSYRYLVELDGRNPGETGEALIAYGRPVIAVIIGASMVAFDVAAEGPLQAGVIARRTATAALGEGARITPSRKPAVLEEST